LKNIRSYADALQLVIRKSMKLVRLTHAETMAAARTVICEHDDFDVVLLDFCLPDSFGFEGLVELCKHFPKLPIVVISAFSDPGVVKTALVCGAAGLIPKTVTIDAILRGIRDVLAGDVTLPDDFLLPVNSVAIAELETLISRLRTLTKQQFCVLLLLCQGLLNEQIARELHVCASTIKSHVTQVLRKLGACSRTHAVGEVSRLSLSAARALYASESVVLTLKTDPI